MEQLNGQSKTLLTLSAEVCSPIQKEGQGCPPLPSIRNLCSFPKLSLNVFNQVPTQRNKVENHPANPCINLYDRAKKKQNARHLSQSISFPMLPPTEISGHSDNRDNVLTYYKPVISWIYSAGHSIEVIFVTV